jgi:hypothetical protein
LTQLSRNANCICVTTGPSTRTTVSRQCSFVSASPSQSSAMPTPPQNPTSPSMMSSFRCVRWLTREMLYQRSG